MSPVDWKVFPVMFRLEGRDWLKLTSAPAVENVLFAIVSPVVRGADSMSYE